MRNIQYRGLRTDGEGWVYGDLLSSLEHGTLIMETFHDSGNGMDEPPCDYQDSFQVHPETIGQSLIPDIKGVMIYEGDTIICKGQLCEVRFDESHLYYALFNIAVGCKVVNLSKNNVGKFDMEISGNVHQKQTKL